MPPRRRFHLLALIPLFLGSCTSLQQGNGLFRVRHPMDRAAGAWQRLGQKNLAQDQVRDALGDYRQAVTQVVLDLARKPPASWGEQIEVPGRDTAWTLTIDRGPASSGRVWNPSLFDGLELATPPHGLRRDQQHLLRQGIGAPFLGERKPGSAGADGKFIPPKGQFLPVTAFLDFTGPHTAVLRLHDPRNVPRVQAGGKTWRLAADFFTPVHDSLGPANFVWGTIGGILQPGNFMDKKGLFLMEPYRPDKTPVIFVHGLLADPHIWEAHAAALMADPELAPHIQCWYFVYPSGLPVMFSAAWLRESLALLKTSVDPEADDPAFHNMLAVGHSMGGLLSRLQVTDSNDTFWNTWFSAPPERLRVGEEMRAELVRMLYFKANPDISRIIFMNTPHRGSKFADSFVGRWGSALVQDPAAILTLISSVIRLDGGLISPKAGGFVSFGVDSIHSMSPTHPFMLDLSEQPVKAKYHSIIGSLFEREDVTKTSDGVVPYSSAHLPGAESEKVVPYWHGSVSDKATVDEVRHIARFHVLGKY